MPDEKSLEDKTKEREEEDLTSSEEDEEEEVLDQSSSSESKEIKKLREEAKRWRLRAKENKAAVAKAAEAEKRLVDAENKAQSALAEVQKIQTISDKRIIEAEVRSLAAEFGLRKIEYARLGSGFEKLKVREDGSVEGAREMFEKLKQSDPELFKGVTTTNTNFQGNVKGVDKPEKKVLNMNKEDYAKAEAQFLKEASRR
ncbi:MAG TPA: hypothetical protein PLF59_08135 [Cyclobacteriaceae bacterium]|nr:hypothetical protein [Cyclobacteriaceae bacterium]